MAELHILVLWHYLNDQGVAINATVTEFRGTIIELQEMIKGNDVRNRGNMNSGIVPHQIIPLPT
jgi:hypothetical protein